MLQSEEFLDFSLLSSGGVDFSLLRSSSLSFFTYVHISLFGGGFFPRGFPSFSAFMRDCIICLAFVHGYLTWLVAGTHFCIIP